MSGVVRLGTRWIALRPICKFVAGPGGDERYRQVDRFEDGSPVIERYEVHHTNHLYDNPGTARYHANGGTRGKRTGAVHGRVLAIDLDAQPEYLTNGSPQAEYEDAERLATYWGEEAQRRLAIVRAWGGK